MKRFIFVDLFTALELLFATAIGGESEQDDGRVAALCIKCSPPLLDAHGTNFRAKPWVRHFNSSAAASGASRSRAIDVHNGDGDVVAGGDGAELLRALGIMSCIVRFGRARSHFREAN